MAEANKEVNNGVYRKIIESNLQPKFLTNEESEELINLEEEKYRMKMEKKWEQFMLTLMKQYAIMK